MRGGIVFHLRADVTESYMIYIVPSVTYEEVRYNSHAVNDGDIFIKVKYG